MTPLPVWPSFPRPGLWRAFAGLGLLLLATGLALTPAPAKAQAAQGDAPRHGFFLGLGLGLQGVNFGHQSLAAGSAAQLQVNGGLAAASSAWGEGSTDIATPVTAAPEIRLGYFRHFGNSPWLWGFRASYADLLADETETALTLPESGVLALANSPGLQPFSGTATVQSYRVQADSRFGAMPFIGRDLGPGFVYLGLGGTMTHATTTLSGVTGIVTPGGALSPGGAGQDFSSSGWVLGAGATLGGTYFLTHNWFLDIAYSFTETAAQVGRYFSSFSGTSANGRGTTSGTFYGQSSERIITHGVTITINRTF